MKSIAIVQTFFNLFFKPVLLDSGINFQRGWVHRRWHRLQNFVRQMLRKLIFPKMISLIHFEKNFACGMWVQPPPPRKSSLREDLWPPPRKSSLGEGLWPPPRKSIRCTWCSECYVYCTESHLGSQWDKHMRLRMLYISHRTTPPGRKMTKLVLRMLCILL